MGPVLQAGALANAIVAAIRSLQEAVVVVDRGAYLRVLVPGRCSVTRAAIERCLGESVRLRKDLEAIMPSFKGRFRVTDDVASWDLGLDGDAR